MTEKIIIICFTIGISFVVSSINQCTQKENELIYKLKSECIAKGFEVEKCNSIKKIRN